MKKVLALLLVLLLVGVPAFAESFVVHVTAYCYDPNHVGSKWEGRYFIGETEIKDCDIVQLFEGEYEITSEIGEYDSTPDVGTYTSKYNMTPTRLSRGFTVKQTVQVYENSGVYKGYWTEWFVEIDFVAVEGAYYVLD